MNAEEAFSAFLSGLTPHLQEHVGAHVQGDLEAAKHMALRMDMFRGGVDSGKSQQQKGQGGQKKKGNVHAVEAQQPAGPSQVNAVQGPQPRQHKNKKGKGKKGKKGEGDSGEQGRGKCFACGGNHYFNKCSIWLEMQKKCGIKPPGNA